MKPNKRASSHTEVAWLLDQDTILLEDGTEMPYEHTFDGTRIFTSGRTAKKLWNVEKVGETLWFDKSIRKWRKKCPAHYKTRNSWPGSSLEVTTIDSRSCPDNPKEAIEGLAQCRDWIEENGGNLKGSFSSASVSLFKASLKGQEYETPYIGIEEITNPMGGRLLPCKSLYTSFIGNLVQYDLHSAYSRTLGNLQFGGPGSCWIETNRISKFDLMAEQGKVIFIEAEVRIPEMRLGPLPERRERNAKNLMWDWLSFPVNTTIRGIWTYQEIRQAEIAGCKIKVIRAIYHQATGRKYWHEDWYNIILSGRNLSGFAKSLAKQIGNSLWGRYAMRPRPSRTKWRDENGKRHTEIRDVRVFKATQCMELADALCGNIRASLFEFAVSAGNLLLQGNTDGGWTIYDGTWRPPSDDWRNKKRATRLDIIDDRTYRYWEPGSRDAEIVAPGIDIDFQDRMFNSIWNEKERKVVCLS